MAHRTLGLTPAGTICRSNLSLSLYPIPGMLVGRHGGYCPEIRHRADRDRQLVVQNALAPMEEKGFPLPPAFSIFLSNK